jgi:hypothetical protein
MSNNVVIRPMLITLMLLNIKNIIRVRTILYYIIPTCEHIYIYIYTYYAVSGFMDCQTRHIINTVF